MTKNYFKHITRGTLFAVITSLILVLLFAGMLLTLPIGDGFTKPVVQVIKVLSIFVGVLVALKQIEGRGWLHGGIIGLIYTVVAFFIFSIIYSDFSITSGLITDMVFAAIIGGICAMLLKAIRTEAI